MKAFKEGDRIKIYNKITEFYRGRKGKVVAIRENGGPNARMVGVVLDTDPAKEVLWFWGHELIKEDSNEDSNVDD